MRRAESFGFPRLRVRRDDEPHRLQRLDQEAADVRARLADVAHPFRDLRAEPRQRPDAEWHQRHADERQPGVEPEHGCEAASEEQDVAGPREERFSGDALDLADIVVDAREHVAERRPRVEPRRQPLQMAVERQPHVEEHGGRDSRVPQARHRSQREARDRRGGEPADDLVERPRVAPDERPIDQNFREVGERQRNHGADQAQAGNDGEAGAVRSEIADRAPELPPTARAPRYCEVEALAAGGTTMSSVVVSASSVIVRRYLYVAASYRSIVLPAW